MEYLHTILLLIFLNAEATIYKCSVGKKISKKIEKFTEKHVQWGLFLGEF